MPIATTGRTFLGLDYLISAQVLDDPPQLRVVMSQGESFLFEGEDALSLLAQLKAAAMETPRGLASSAADPDSIVWGHSIHRKSRSTGGPPEVPSAVPSGAGETK